MAEERRKKRSHAEVAAAREQYLKEREERKKLREEQKAAQERLRQERLAQRIKKKEKLRVRRERKVDCSHPMNSIKPFSGEVQMGEWYTIRFAGSFIYGQCIEYKGPENSYEDGQGRITAGIYSFESKEPKPGGGFWIYPASQENILCKGILRSEDVDYPNDLKFNGISYY